MGEGERQLRRKRKFNREKDSSMPKNAILQYLVPFFDDSYRDEVEILSVDEDIEIDRDAVDDIEQIIKDAAVDKDDWASIQNMESAIRVLESSTAKIHNNSDLERKQIVETNRRASRHCFRFMSGYRHGLTGNLLDYTQRKYKGHRAIPNFVITDLHKEYDAHCKKNTRIRKFN